MLRVTGNLKVFFQENAFENVICKLVAILFRPGCVNRSSWGPFHLSLSKHSCDTISMVPASHFNGQSVVWCSYTDDSRFAPSQWETALQSNAASHWLGANLESSLSWFGCTAKRTSLCTWQINHLSFVWHIDGLVKDCSYSSELAMELLQSCTKPLVSSVRKIHFLGRFATKMACNSTRPCLVFIMVALRITQEI